MIRCLVVDDSRTFRAMLRTILARAPGVERTVELNDIPSALLSPARLEVQ